MFNIKMIRKISSSLLLLILLLNISISHAIQFKVKLDGSSTYITEIDVSNSDSIINFELLMTPGTAGVYSITFPAGLEKIDLDASSTCASGNISSHTNSSFVFDSTGLGLFCKYILNYNVSDSVVAGTHIVPITGVDPQNVTLNVTSLNSVSSAETIDNDSDGYIDKYKLTFSTGGLTNFSNTNLLVGTLTPTLGSASGSVAYIDFTDGIYTTGEKPQILDTDGLMFDNVGVISETTITEEDKSEPIIMEINSTSIVGVANPSVSISENSKLVIKFSEKVYSTSVSSSFTIEEDNVDVTNATYITFNEENGDTMYYCLGGYDGSGDCNTPFDTNKSYSIEVGENTIDLNSNTYTGGAVDVSISVNDVTSPVAKSITYNSETNNGIVINGLVGSNNYTNNSAGTVVLSIGADDNSGTVQNMCISEDSSLTNDNTCDTGWDSYSTNGNFTFTGTEGTNTLYIKFKDAAGNISSVSSDSIIWDKTEPDTSSTPNGGSFINGSENITLNCTDSISGCDKIYYTTDGTTPTILSSSITSGNTVSISGNNETKTIKFFGVDNVGNLESSINSKDFNFSDSYVSFTNPISLTGSGNITLTGTCNYALGVNDVEYSLNGGGYIDATTDNCDTSNTWSTDLTLASNSSNTIDVRIKAENTLNSNTNIVHDDTAPSNVSIQINNGDTYSNSTNVNLTISASDVNGTQDMCLSESVITNNSICDNSSWESYSNSKAFTLSSAEETKTVYIKFRDEVGNISDVTSDDIILETTTPTVSADLSSGNYTGTKTVTLSSSDTIYYTTDGTTPSNTSTEYSSSFTFGSTEGTVNLKAIAYGISGIDSSVEDYTYVFGCFPSTLSNGSIGAYPSCTKSCNSGYTLSGGSCISTSSSSSGGGGGSSGGGGSTVTDYENIKYISKTKISLLEKVVSKIFSKYGILNTENLADNKVTGDNGILKLRSALKGLSGMIVGPNTSIIGGAKLIYSPYSIEIRRDLKIDGLKVENVFIKSYNIKKLFFAGNEEVPVSFDKEIDMNLNLGSEIEGSVYLYRADSIDGNFRLIKKGLKTDSDGIITFKTSKLGYFIIIRDIYIARYFGTQTVSTEVVNTNDDTEKLVTELKSKVSNQSILELIEENKDKLIIPELDYYASFDSELRSKYETIVLGFTDYILNTDKFISSNEPSFQTLATNAYKEFIKVSELKDFENKYVIKTTREGLAIYKTTYTPIAHLVDALENAMLIKLKKLLEANTISQSKYNQTIKDYNDFILHLSIYRQYGNKAAAYKALTPGRRFLKVYKMKVIQRITSVEEVQEYKPDTSKILIKDKYTFSKELKFGDYNNEVQNLQEIMKSYGSFTYPSTTQYFGNVTKTSLINFSKDYLGVENPSGILTNDLIEKLYLLEYKQ